MTRLFVAVEDALAVIHHANGAWQLEEQLRGLHPYCLAADPDKGAFVFFQGQVQQIGGTSWSLA